MLHRPSVGDASRDLLGDALRNQPGFDFRNLDLFDPDVDLLADFLLEHLPQAFDIRALLADHDSGLGGVKRDVDLVGRSLQLDPGDSGPGQLFHDQLADLEILVQQISIRPFREPFRFPVTGDSQPESDWIDFASH